MVTAEPATVMALRSKIDEVRVSQDLHEWINSTADLLQIDLGTAPIWTGEGGALLIFENKITWSGRTDHGPDIEIDLTKTPFLVGVLILEMKRRIMVELTKTEGLLSFGAATGPPDDWMKYQILDLGGNEVPHVIWADAVQGVVCIHDVNKAGKYMRRGYVNGIPDVQKEMIMSRILITRPQSGGSFF